MTQPNPLKKQKFSTHSQPNPWVNPTHEQLWTTRLKAVVDVIGPFLKHLFNCSLSSGIVPESFKTAYVSPLLKKSDMDPADTRLYRPISNLSVVSKVLERQLLAYLDACHRACFHGFSLHTGPTTLLRQPCWRYCHDVLLAIDAGDLSALTLLDLSEDFDTVDHDILLRRLQTSYGINGVMLQWFQTYLADRRQYVRTASTTFTPAEIACGIPQLIESVLGPILFLLYTADLPLMIEDHGLCSHLYADDTHPLSLFSEDAWRLFPSGVPFDDSLPQLW